MSDAYTIEKYRPSVERLVGHGFACALDQNSDASWSRDGALVVDRLNEQAAELASLRAKVAAMDETLRNVAFYLHSSGIAAQCAPSLIEQLETCRASVGERGGG